MEHIGTIGRQIAERLRAQMAADGLPLSATTSTPGSPTCELCGDLGWVRRDVPLGDPDFGRLVTCPTCGMGVAIRRQASAARTGRYCVHLPEQRFEEFKGRGGVVDTALAAAQRFAESPARCMVLWGPPGTGKTHLVAAAANRLRERGEDVGFFTAPDLLDLLRSGYDRGDYEALLDALKNLPVLVLDDLGAERGTEWAEEKLFQVINHRYNRRLPLLVAMNPDPGTLEPRIADRLCDVDWSLRIHVEVTSWRRRQVR